MLKTLYTAALPRATTLAGAALLTLGYSLQAPASAATTDVQPWMGTPEGAYMMRLEAIVPECKRLYDRDTRYRNQEGPLEDRPATTKCIEDGQRTGKAQLDLVSANSAYKLDLGTVHLKWSAWLATMSVTSTLKTSTAKQAYDFAADQLKAKLNAAAP